MHQGCPGGDAKALSSGSGGGGSGSGVSSDREDDREKQVRGQGNRLMIPRSVKKRNCGGERVRSLRRGGGRGVEGQVKVVVGSGYGAGSVHIRSSLGGGYLAGGSTAPKMGRRLIQHRSCGGGVEGVKSDFKLPLRRLHHLT